MTKSDAIAIVRAKYPRAVVVENETVRRSELLTDILSPNSARFSVPGPPSDAWVSFAGYILDGVDF